MLTPVLRRPAIVTALLGFLTPLIFVLYTGRIWEDFFITFRISQNLVHGHGLVFQTGERVHTFTSPLGTLLPALCSFLVGGNNDPVAIWIFRIVSCGFLAGSATLLLDVARQLRFSRGATLLLLSLFILDPKIADFTTNGMETGLLLFFFVWTLRALIEAEPIWWRVAIGVSGLMWTRPDGFVFFGALIAGLGVFDISARQPEQRRTAATKVGLGLAAGILLYLPWVLWAWSYYGSPIPNTIIAKSVLLPPDFPRGLLLYPLNLLMGKAQVLQIFLPTYFVFGGWPAALGAFSTVIVLPAVLFFLVPRAQPAVRGLSLALCVGGSYLEISRGNFPWYLQVWQTLALVVFAAIVHHVAGYFKALGETLPATARRYARIGRLTAVALILIQLGLFASMAVEMRLNQIEIEDKVRRPIGEWLRTNSQPGQTVLLEPLGYIGYFSGLKMLDVPGLSAPEVTKAIKAGINTWPALIEHFKPDWLVVRHKELQEAISVAPDRFKAEYAFAMGRDAKGAVAGWKFYPGRDYAAFDAVFYVFRRTSPKGAPSGDPKS